VDSAEPSTSRCATACPTRESPPPQRAIDHLAEYKRIGLSHVVIDFGRDVAGEPSALASPICYAAEIDPTHFGEDKE
jgi:hypothetical protein